MLREWERELLANHRWGRLRKWLPEREVAVDDERIKREHARLRLLWERAQPLTQSCEDIVRSIVALEICNWDLERSITGLCEAIGSKTPPKHKIGHNNSITELL